MKLVVRLLTENYKFNNSFLWRQLAASGPSPNTSFVSPTCPQPKRPHSEPLPLESAVR